MPMESSGGGSIQQQQVCLYSAEPSLICICAICKINYHNYYGILGHFWHLIYINFIIFHYSILDKWKINGFRYLNTLTVYAIIKS